MQNLTKELQNWRTDKMGENISTRVAYGLALEEFGDRDNVYVFDADLKSCTTVSYTHLGKCFHKMHKAERGYGFAGRVLYCAGEAV